jgi:hypothetical protein
VAILKAGFAPANAACTDSAIKHLVHIGLDDLKVLFFKNLAVTMLKQIQDLEHDIVANLCAREERC